MNKIKKSILLVIVFSIVLVAEETKHNITNNHKPVGVFADRNFTGKEIVDLSEYDVETKDDIVYFKESSEKFSGVLRGYYDDDKMYEDEYKNGKQEGLRKDFYLSGKLKEEMVFKDNKANGIAKSYYESGILECEIVFKDNKANGIAKCYFESGKLKKETIWKDDKRNGIAKSYFESGKLKDEGVWKDDKRNGIAKSYFESGKLKLLMTYKNGNVYEIKSYYDSGALCSKIISKEGMLYEEGDVHFLSGEIETNYSFSINDGVGNFFNEDGSLKMTIKFKNSKAQSGTIYHKNGSVLRKMTKNELEKVSGDPEKFGGDFVIFDKLMLR